MTDISQILIPKGFKFGATKAGLKASGRVYGEQGERRAAGDR
jgi:hypothetical protein